METVASCCNCESLLVCLVGCELVSSKDDLGALSVLWAVSSGQNGTVADDRTAAQTGRDGVDAQQESSLIGVGVGGDNGSVGNTITLVQFDHQRYNLEAKR